MLTARLVLGTLLVAALAGILYLDWRVGTAAPFFLAMALGLALRGAYELLGLVSAHRPVPSRPLVYLAVAAVTASNWIAPLGFCPNSPTGPLGPLVWPLVALTLAFLMLLAAAALRYRAPGGEVESLGVQLLVLLYMGLLATFAVQLRWVGGAQVGMLAFISLIATAKGGDIGAYTIGRLFGRHRLAPLLSPNKTIEGALGGLVGSVAAAAIVLQFFPAWFDSRWIAGPWSRTVGFGLVVGCVAQMGDLAESFLKRDLEQKDSAPLMRGLGGILDVLDSVLYAAPIAFLFWVFGGVGPATGGP